MLNTALFFFYLRALLRFFSVYKIFWYAFSLIYSLSFKHLRIQSRTFLLFYYLKIINFLNADYKE